MEPYPAVIKLFLDLWSGVTIDGLWDPYLKPRITLKLGTYKASAFYAISFLAPKYPIF